MDTIHNWKLLASEQKGFDSGTEKVGRTLIRMIDQNLMDWSSSREFDRNGRKGREDMAAKGR